MITRIKDWLDRRMKVWHLNRLAAKRNKGSDIKGTWSVVSGPSASSETIYGVTFTKAELDILRGRDAPCVNYGPQEPGEPGERYSCCAHA